MFTFNEGATATRKVLDRIPISVRDKGEITSRWKGIQHGELADTLVDRAENMGFKVKAEAWSTVMDGAGMFGTLVLAPTPQLKIEVPKGVGLALGVRHSNNGRYALSFFAGARVLVCANGMISNVFTPGDRKRHTVNLSLQETIDEGLTSFGEHARKSLGREIGIMRGMDYGSPLKVHHLLCEAGARGIVPWSQLGKVDKAWRTPPHSEFKPRNGWSLYNAFTEVAKSFAPVGQAEAINGVRILLSEVAKSGYKFN